MKYNKTITLFVTLFISSFLFFQSFKSSPDVAGKLKFKIGKVSIIRQNERIENIKINDEIYLGDKVETKNQSRAELELINGSIVKVNQNTLFTVDKLKKDGKDQRNSFSLSTGSIWLKVKKLFSSTDEFSVKTPTAVCAVRGTEFQMNYSGKDSLQVLVKEGTVDVGEADLLRNFDSFVDWLKENDEAFKKWKEKNNGEEFFEKDYKEFMEFKDQEEDEFQAFLRGEKLQRKPKEWIKSINQGDIIIIRGDRRIIRKYNENDILSDFKE